MIKQIPQRHGTYSYNEPIRTNSDSKTRRGRILASMTAVDHPDEKKGQQENFLPEILLLPGRGAALTGIKKALHASARMKGCTLLSLPFMVVIDPVRRGHDDCFRQVF